MTAHMSHTEPVHKRWDDETGFKQADSFAKLATTWFGDEAENKTCNVTSIPLLDSVFFNCINHLLCFAFLLTVHTPANINTRNYCLADFSCSKILFWGTWRRSAVVLSTY